MAENEYVNKVTFGNKTLIDISSDSVQPEAMLRGTTAHNRSGAPIVGIAYALEYVTQAEYDAMKQAGTLDPDTYYAIGEPD